MELTQMILDKQITYFHKVAEIVMQEHEDWFNTLTANAFYIKAVVMSLAIQNDRKERK